MTSFHAPSDSPSSAPAMVTSSPSTLTVRQRYWSWFKRTGRGFTVTKADGSILFVVGSKDMGKHRTIEDGCGKPLLSLDRNWTSKKRAWLLESSGLKSNAETILTVEYSWVRWKISVKASRAEAPIAYVQASDNAGGHLRITSGEATLATMQYQNMTAGILSSFMATPPTWSIKHRYRG